jgi:hypothetical protein
MTADEAPRPVVASVDLRLSSVQSQTQRILDHHKLRHEDPNRGLMGTLVESAVGGVRNTTRHRSPKSSNSPNLSTPPPFHAAPKRAASERSPVLDPSFIEGVPRSRVRVGRWSF